MSMPSTLIASLQAGASINPAAPAIIASDGIVSHGQLLSLVGATARRLYEDGVRPGDILGVSMQQGPLHCVAVLALARLGVISVPFAPDMAPAVRDQLMAACGIRSMLSSWPATPGLPFHVLTLGTVTARPQDARMDFLDFQPTAATPLRVALSSGTTKVPRGVLHSNRDWLLRITRTLVDCDATSRLIPPDLHITLATVFAHGVLCAGGAVVFPKTYTRDDLVLTVNQCAVTHLIMAPANIAPMAAILPDQGIMMPTLKHLRLVGTTPAPGLLARLRRHCTPHVCVPYGLTELGPISMANSATLEHFPDSVGPVYPWARVEILDKMGQAVPAGVNGQIRVAVDPMPAGYFCDDNADGKFRDGWFHPGDSGRMDTDGRLFVEGRIDDILNIGGHKTHPENLEAALCEHPGVADAAVHLQAGAGGESRLIALIVQRPGAAVDDLPAFAERRLDVLAPHHFCLVGSLPRNAMGKLQRDRLPELSAAVTAGRRT